MNFEQYLNDFNTTINIWQFLLNILVVTLIAFIIKKFYIRYGKAISNRERFANNFIPLALGTLLIITVIGSSVALSLGLVGALSIVRFRAAIKDPEELIYLFLIIGLGLTGGANKPLLALVSFAILIPLLYLNNVWKSQETAHSKNATLHINVNNQSVEVINQLLSPYTDFIKLKRVDYLDSITKVSYHCQFKNSEGLDDFASQLKGLDNTATLSYIDQPDLLL